MIELPVTLGVVRGLWKSVSKSTKTVYVMDVADDVNQCHMESIAQDAKNEEIIVVDEDAEEVEAMVSVDNMKKLIKAQWKSKCSRYMQIVRESEEFG